MVWNGTCLCNIYIYIDGEVEERGERVVSEMKCEAEEGGMVPVERRGGGLWRV